MNSTMKLTLLVLSLLPLAVLAQDCKLIKEKDPYTRETKVSTGFMELQGGTVTVDADSREIDFFFSIPGKCFNDASTVFIYFDGAKNKTTYRNAGSVNCDGNFHFKFKNGQATNTVLQKLSTQKVAHFIFVGSDKKEITIDLIPEQQESFMKAVNCLVTDAKTLIK